MTNSVSCGLAAKNERSKASRSEKSGGLGKTPCVNANSRMGIAIVRSKICSTPNVADHRGVARVRDGRLDEEELDHVAAAGRDDVVEAVGRDVGAPDQAVGDLLVRVGGAQRVVQRLGAQREVADERHHPQQERDQADRREAVEEASDRVEEVPRAVKDRGERHEAEGIRRHRSPRPPCVSCPAHEHRDRNTGNTPAPCGSSCSARASSGGRSSSRPSAWAARSSRSIATRARRPCRSPTVRPSSTWPTRRRCASCSRPSAPGPARSCWSCPRSRRSPRRCSRSWRPRGCGSSPRRERRG